MSASSYKQVRLERTPEPDVTAACVCWIDAKHARVGARVRLLDDDHDPDDVWTVTDVYGRELDRKRARDMEGARKRAFPSIQPA